MTDEQARKEPARNARGKAREAERKARQAEMLRENLLKRKAQSRARKEDGNGGATE